MNFGGGPPFGPPFNAYQTGMPVFPPAYPGMMPPQTFVPGAMPSHHIQTNYPQGQGPLAGRPAQRGVNGLYEAPEPDRPEQHEAQQYMRLNPGEALKYGEYWAEAIGDGDEELSGQDAVAFMSRASRVSKGQLRRIWDIADHRKEGALDRDAFYIALRLLALAQRGAELSVGGLRNFTGIQLIPDVQPQIKELPDEGEPKEGAVATDGFSWMVKREVAARYDAFFTNLDSRKAGMIDGRQGVTFFGKSGLPRPTLKRIWELADVTRDGLLSRDEFRAAMHLVASIRNKKLTVTALPSTLDPAGPNWLRIEGELPPQDSSPAGGIEGQAPILMGGAVGVQASGGQVPGGQAPIILGGGTEGPLGSPIRAPSSSSLSPRPPPDTLSPLQMAQRGEAITMPPVYEQMGAGGMPQQMQAGMMPQQMQQGMAAQQMQRGVAAQQAQGGMTPQQIHQGMPPPPVQDASGGNTQNDETKKMLEELRKEKMQMEQARREMEEMKAEMEKMRLEHAARAQAPVAVAPAGPSAPYGAPLQRFAGNSGAMVMPPSGTEMSPAPPPPPIMASPIALSNSPRVSSPTAPTAPMVPMTPIAPIAAAAPMAPMATMAPTTARQEPAPQPKSPMPFHKQPISPVKKDDDDIWDQPSPKASALPGPAIGVGKKGALQSNDSVSSDDDDFWGGIGGKPTLGPAGGQNPGGSGSGNTGKGFGGSELDDWVF